MSHQDSRLVLAPGRPRDEMIAASVQAGDPLQGSRQAAIAFGDEIGELIDLFRRFRRRLDLYPAPDAVENLRRIERGGGHWRADIQSMIRKGGNRSCKKIMLEQRDEIMIRYRPIGSRSTND
jgi:hypothetical protein